MRRAGYDSAKSAMFWAQMAGTQSGEVQTSSFNSTHPSFPERAAGLRLAHEEIEAKIAAGEQLRPNIDPDAGGLGVGDREAAAERRAERWGRDD